MTTDAGGSASSASSVLKIGKSVLALGPSGSGKSHLVSSALGHLGSGVLVLAQGSDEIESYRDFYEDADFLLTGADVERLIQKDADGSPFLASSKPYIIAAFDDADFSPSIGEWKATGLASALTFLRLVRKKVAAAADAGEEPPYAMLATDTFSGLGELAHNAMCSVMRITEPPKARGEGGAQYYIGYKGKLQEIARSCRVLRGHGLDWFATSHVQLKEASDTFSGQDVVAKEQQMPLFTGSFREVLPGFFDMVLYTGIDARGNHYAQFEPDKFRQSKSRYAVSEDALDSKRRLPNTWPEIAAAIK